MAEIEVNTLRPGDIFGEMSLLHFSSTTSASVVADSPVVELDAMQFEFIENLFQTSNRLMKRFYYEVKKNCIDNTC